MYDMKKCRILAESEGILKTNKKLKLVFQKARNSCQVKKCKCGAQWLYSVYKKIYVFLI